MAAMLMAINIVLSSFSLPVPGGHIYLNDIIIVAASIILSPVYAFVAGGVGAFLGDFFFYPRAMLVSFVVRSIQSIVISVFSHYVMKKSPVGASAIGTGIGAVIMVLGYFFGKVYVYSTYVEAVAKLPFQILQAVAGALIGFALCWKLGLKKTYESIANR